MLSVVMVMVSEEESEEKNVYGNKRIINYIPETHIAYPQHNFVVRQQFFPHLSLSHFLALYTHNVHRNCRKLYDNTFLCG